MQECRRPCGLAVAQARQRVQCKSRATKGAVHVLPVRCAVPGTQAAKLRMLQEAQAARLAAQRAREEAEEEERTRVGLDQAQQQQQQQQQQQEEEELSRWVR